MSGPLRPLALLLLDQAPPSVPAVVRELDEALDWSEVLGPRAGALVDAADRPLLRAVARLLIDMADELRDELAARAAAAAAAKGA